MTRITRRGALKAAAATFTAPFVWRLHAHAAPSEAVLHASFGAGGMAGADIDSLSASKNLQLVAVAEVDANQKKLAELKKRWPALHVYADYRQLFDKEKGLNSVNVSTPDHMHAPIGMMAVNRGLNVYGQKPLTQTIFEARKLTEAAAAKRVVTQMGIQIHSARKHKLVVKLVQDGVIGKVKEVHSWSGQVVGRRHAEAGPRGPGAGRARLGPVAGRRGRAAVHRRWVLPPGNWRKRLDFGTGTFGDMGCHILDPVFNALGVGNPSSITSELPGPNEYNWSLDVQVRYVFPGSKFTTDPVSLTWYNGKVRPPKEVVEQIGSHKLDGQGSILVGTEGVMYSPYDSGGQPILIGEKFKDFKMPDVKSDDHYGQYVEAVRGNGQTSAPFGYSGPLTEMVLLGCLATRFPKTDLSWDTKGLKFTNNEKANAFVRREYRKGFEVEGL
jgi:predicted dehydrogenase